MLIKEIVDQPVELHLGGHVVRRVEVEDGISGSNLSWFELIAKEDLTVGSYHVASEFPLGGNPIVSAELNAVFRDAGAAIARLYEHTGFVFGWVSARASCREGTMGSQRQKILKSCVHQRVVGVKEPASSFIGKVCLYALAEGIAAIDENASPGDVRNQDDMSLIVSVRNRPKFH